MSLSEIFTTAEESNLRQKIVEELLNTEDNLSSKTELAKPLKWGCLNVVREFLQEKKLPKCIQILANFESVSFKYLISKERKGREEYIQALQSLAENTLQDEKNAINNKPIQ